MWLHTRIKTNYRISSTSQNSPLQCYFYVTSCRLYNYFVITCFYIKDKFEKNSGKSGDECAFTVRQISVIENVYIWN